MLTNERAFFVTNGRLLDYGMQPRVLLNHMNEWSVFSGFFFLKKKCIT